MRGAGAGAVRWRRAAAILTAAGLMLGGSLATLAATASSAAPVKAAAPPGAATQPSSSGRPSAARRPARSRQVRLPRPALAVRAAYVVARRTGHAVPVAGKTDAQSQLSVLPDGLLDMVSNAQPVRVQIGTSWVPMSTRLQRTPDGSWAARRTGDPVWFSPGGRGPLVTIRPRGSTGWVSVYWPARLPAPSVSGSVALYRNVLPGVDLRLEATSPGYQETLVVTSAAAARDAGLSSLALAVRVGGGLVLRRGADGSLDAVWARSGKLALMSGQPQMWGSLAPGPHVIAATADYAGSGRVTEIPTRYQVSDGTYAVIRMTPPAAALTGRGTRAPFYIDPEFDPSQDYYAQVMQADDGSGYTQAWTTATGTTSLGGGAVEVGYCGYSDCTWAGHATYTDRDYFRFAAGDLGDGISSAAATVYYVNFSDEELANSDGCTTQPSALWSSHAISSSTTWPGPEVVKVAAASSNAGGSSSCSEPKANVDFTAEQGSSVNPGLLTAIQGDATADAGNGANESITLALQADNESTDLQYKVYSDNPTLEVIYNYPPLTPVLTTDESASPTTPISQMVSCTSTNYTASTEPTFTATGQDGNPADASQQVTLLFTVQDSAGDTVGSASATGSGASGKAFSANTTPSETLTSGDGYKFDVKATNASVKLPDGTVEAGLSSSPSSFFDFTVLHQTPPAPSISSYDYPQNYWDDVSGTWLAAGSEQPQWGQPAGAPGYFTVGANGGSDIAGFSYSFSSSDVPSIADDDCSYNDGGGLGTSMNSDGVGGNSSGVGELGIRANGTAQIPIPTGMSSGQHTLYVKSFDDAHTMSSEAAYTFYVSPDYQSGNQAETTIAGNSLVSGATGANASLLGTQANCCGLTWDGGSQLWFQGTATGQTFTVHFTVPGSGANTWQLGADLTTSFNYAEGEFELVPPSGSPVPLAGTQTMPWNGYAAVSLKYLDLGTQVLTGGDTYGLMFTVTGEDASSTGYQFGLNYLTLSPTNRYEAEGLATGTPTAGTLAAQYAAGWSGNGQLLYTNTTKGASFTLDFNVGTVEADYAVGLMFTEASDDGQVRVDLDPATTDLNLGSTATYPIDTYSATATEHYVFLGGVHLTAGQHVLKLTVVGADSASSGFSVGLDYLEAAPVTGVTDQSFTDAMNNLGIAPQDSGTFTGDFDGTAGNDNLSAVALAAAGVTVGTASGAGSSFSLNGASFTMPELQSSSGTVTADNVIAAGQTVPLASPVRATDAALLVAATCNVSDDVWTTSSPKVYATLNYGGSDPPGPSQDQVPPVPDWTAGPSSTAVMVLSHSDAGTTPESGKYPRLYEVMLPANPAGQLTSITLPLMAGGYLSEQQGCSGVQLHVLGIGVRPVAPAPSAGTVWDGAFSAPMDEAIFPWSGLANTTLREIITPTATGSGLVRIHLSNAHSSQAVKFDQVTIAAEASGGGPAAVASSMENVTFGGSASVTLPAGGDADSDAVTMPTGGSGSLVISLYVDSAYDVTSMPIHLTPNQEPNLTTFWASGNDTTNTDGTDFSNTSSNAGDDYIAGVDVSDATTTDGTVTVLGDQLATQAPQYSMGNWPDDLPSALSAAGVALPGAIASTSTSGTQPAHWWQLTGQAPLSSITTTGYDSGSAGNDSVTLQKTASWTTANPGTGSFDGSVSLDGSSGYALGSGPAVTTTSSFTVTAWAYLSSLPTQSVTVAAQDGTVNSGFSLGIDYTAGTADWAFSFPASDSDNATSTVALGPAAAAGTWTQLAGVYNTATGDAELFVNGAQAATVAVTPWAASGSFTIGAGLSNGARSGYFPGDVSDVRTFSEALWPTGVSEVYNDNGTSTLSSANGISAFENITEAEPDVRDVIIALGANDVLQGASAESIEGSLTALVTAITSRTDPATGKPVQAFLTTIPPLGLASADPREAVREQVNEWIMDASGTYVCPTSSGPVTGAGGSTLSADLACAVANPSNLATVSPALLTSGVPNASYYSALAQALAAAIENSGGGIPGLGVTL
jgi:lysophospholipase L1-like esterase